MSAKLLSRNYKNKKDNKNNRQRIQNNNKKYRKIRYVLSFNEMISMELKECTLIKRKLWNNYLILSRKARCWINKPKEDLESNYFLIFSLTGDRLFYDDQYKKKLDELGFTD